MHPIGKAIHFVGVGGVGMGSLAVELARNGYEVSGSDGKLYEPMKGVLAASKIQLTEGYSAATPQSCGAQMVVIGNVVRKDNPEVVAWLAKGTSFVSFPEAIRRLLIEDKKSVVCAGTHGKTTTTSWVAFLLTQLDLNPSFLIGGVPRDLPQACMLTTGDWFVGEGDEYDSAFFDKGPKFLHYNPHFLILSNIEFDHADIYRDLQHVQAAFEKLIALLPGDGLCIARSDDKVVMEVVGQSLCPVQTFGVGSAAMWRLGKVEETPAGMSFEVVYKGRSTGVFQSPLFGEHNLMNLLSGLVAVVNMGISLEKVRNLVPLFHGAKRRQEILLESPNLVIDDFAHHPTEVQATLSAVRRRYPDRKIWALFEPRSATARRNVHQKDYVAAFACADAILLIEAFRGTELPEEDRFSAKQLAADLTASGKVALCLDSPGAVLESWLGGRKEGDVVVVMSNGDFGGIQKKIVGACGGGN